MKAWGNENLFDLLCRKLSFLFGLNPPSPENPRPMSLCKADDLRETGEV